MTQQVLEGTWEEIARHAHELKGRHVRLAILSAPAGETAPLSHDAPAASEWPERFFEQTFGSLADAGLERLSQGEFEQREAV